MGVYSNNGCIPGFAKFGSALIFSKERKVIQKKESTIGGVKRQIQDILISDNRVSEPQCCCGVTTPRLRRNSGGGTIFN